MLSRFWYLFAGLSLVLGLAGIVMGLIGAAQFYGPWEPWPHPPIWDWTLTGHAVWPLLAIRVILAAIAGQGLHERAIWGRQAAIMAAFVSILEFPIGLVLGAYTLVVLLGRNKAALYSRRA